LVVKTSENTGLHCWIKNLKFEKSPLSESFTTYNEGGTENNAFDFNDIVNNIQTILQLIISTYTSGITTKKETTGATKTEQTMTVME
jgi:uncharacterized membrane protein